MSVNPGDANVILDRLDGDGEAGGGRAYAMHDRLEGRFAGPDPTGSYWRRVEA